ncbi:unnamed protein product [Protopolystoma xenopodis]|uniref:Uncharacterized protein n=1 Tax=Protopolystoma xenopodis TaxID=117903 RepID=A0A3S5FF33_9PLAT|nr:unnamed protein product [Protopolystoma xenopodis]
MLPHLTRQAVDFPAVTPSTSYKATVFAGSEGAWSPPSDSIASALASAFKPGQSKSPLTLPYLKLSIADMSQKHTVS